MYFVKSDKYHFDGQFIEYFLEKKNP